VQGNLYFGNQRIVDRDNDLYLGYQPLTQKESFYMLSHFGPYMHGMGFMLSSSVVNFLGTSKIPPKQTWCEDVMVGMWLLPYQVTWLDANAMHFPVLNRHLAVPMARSGHTMLLTHYMQDQDWETINESGMIMFTENDETMYYKLSK
jgi:hypothetical protein